MNRINRYIFKYSARLYKAIWIERFDISPIEAANLDEAKKIRAQLRMWVNISQAIRGWHL